MSDTNGTEISSSDLGVSFVLYTVIGATLLISYTLLRRRKFFYTRVYYPNYPHEDVISDYDRTQRKDKLKPPSRTSLFGWFLFLMSSKRDNDVLRHAGLDAYATLRATRIPLITFTVWTVFSMILLVPGYASRSEDGEERPDLLTAISLANLNQDNEGLFIWIWFSMLFLVFLILYLMKSEYEHFIGVRKRYLATKAKESYTVVVERVPRKFLSKSVLRRYFDVLIGGVMSIDLVPNSKITAIIAKLVAIRSATMVTLEIVQQRNKKKGDKKMITSYDRRTHLEELKTLDFESNQLGLEKNVEDLKAKENQKEEDIDAEGRDKIDRGFDLTAEQVVKSEDFQKLLALAKIEKGGIGFVNKLKGVLNSLSCGAISTSGQKIDAEKYYTERLEGLNTMIKWLQIRAETLTDSDHQRSGKDVNMQNMFEPSARGFSNLLDSTRLEEQDNDNIQLLEEFGKKSAKKGLLNTLRKRDVESKKETTQTEAKKLSDEAEKTHSDIKNSVFITFDSKFRANVINSVAINEVRDQMLASRAKKPADMKLPNLGFSPLYKTMISFVVFLLIALFIIFFGTIVTVIGVLTNVENLRENVDFLDDLLDRAPFIVDLIEQAGPFALILAFILVPPVLLATFELSKPISLTEKHTTFLMAYYAFAVIQLFLFYQASGSVATIFGEALNDPAEIVNILADTIPNNAIFFMQFILIKTLFVLPNELIRFTPIITGLVLRNSLTCQFYSSETDREKYTTKCFVAGPIQKTAYPFLALINGQAMLIHTIGLCYLIITPLMGPICVAYCLTFIFVMRNQFLFVYSQPLREMDSLGTQFSTMLSTYIIALALLVALMIGMFALNEQAALATASFPVLIIVGLSRVYFSKVYGSELDSLPLSLAKLYDTKLKKKFEEADESDPLLTGQFEDYRHPSLKAPAVETM